MVDFLNDAGPLQREVSKELTSDKVYDSLLEEDEHRRQLQDEARQRKRRRMPMVENLQADSKHDSLDMEGMTVERTTNFSHTSKEDNEHELRFMDGELFELVWKLQKNKTTIEQYLLEEKKIDVNKALQEEGQSHVEQDLMLLKNMKQYFGVPTLMQDTDKALIGAPEHKVETLKFENVRMAPAHVQLSLLAESIQDVQRSKKLKEATLVK